MRGLYLRVGLLVVAGAALAIGAVVFLTADRIGPTGTTYETYLRESVQGLDVGAPVRYRGVQIGRVAEIALVSAVYPRMRSQPFGAAFQLVMVRFAVDTARIGDVPTVEEAVRLGLRARIAAQGITGVYYIELDFVSPTRFPVTELPWEPLQIVIPSIPSTVAQVQSAAEQLLEQLQASDVAGLVASVAGLIADLRGQLGPDGSASVALREAALLLGTLREAATAADLPGTTAALRGATTEAQRVLASPQLRSTLTNAAAAAAELRVAAARLPGAIDGGVRAARTGSADLQAELVPLLRDLRATVANLRDTTEALRRSPSQTLLGAPPPEPRR